MKRNLLLFLMITVMLLSSCDLAGGLASLSPSSPEISVSFATTEEEMTTPEASSWGDTDVATTAPQTTPDIAATRPQTTLPETTDFETTDPVTTNPVTTEPAITPPATAGFSLLSMTETVRRGNTATVTVQGEPGKTYTITVYYPSSVSTAKGLEPKTADEDGAVSWSWRVGSRTTVGTHRIEISDGVETLTLYVTVTS